MKFELRSKGCAQAMLPLEALHNWKVLTNMAKTNEYMQAAVDELEKINLDKALRYEYLRREMQASDETTIREYYTELGEKKGRGAGRSEGRIEGREAGRTEGEEVICRFNVQTDSRLPDRRFTSCGQ